MAETKGSAATPRLRDVVASLRPQVMFWWGTVAGVFVSAVLVLGLAVAGILSFNSASLVSLDPKKVALEIQVGLEEQGVTSTVECPSPITAPVGFSFTCMVGLPTGFTIADVTIGNAFGEIIWNARNKPLSDVSP